MALYNPHIFNELLSYADYADLFIEQSSFTVCAWESSKVDEINTGSDAGFGIRYLIGDAVLFEHKNSVSPDDIITAGNQLSQTLTKKRSVKLNPIIAADHPVRIHPQSISLEKKIVLLRSIDCAIRAIHSSITQVMLSLGEKEKEIHIMNSDGKAVTEKRTYCSLSITVIASNKQCIQTATEVIGGLGGYEVLDESIVRQRAIQTGKRVIDKLSAPSAPVGEMPVVIAAEAGGTMIHEAVGHSLEADAVQKGISPVYYGKKDTSVASPLITVCDDPTLPGKRGSYHYDDEGIKSSLTVLIENGVLKTYLYDYASAHKDLLSSNAHGRRQSYSHRPIPRMSNTYIKSGTDDPREIIRSIPEGLLVKKMGGGQVNTATGDFVFEIEEGYRITKGSVAGLVRGANLLGNGPEVLKTIDRVGNDLGWGLGTCGKEGQGVPVSDAQPTLRIKKLLVGGS